MMSPESSERSFEEKTVLRLSRDTMRELREEFSRNRKKIGIKQADREWVIEPFTQWLACLQDTGLHCRSHDEVTKHEVIDHAVTKHAVIEHAIIRNEETDIATAHHALADMESQHYEVELSTTPSNKGCNTSTDTRLTAAEWLCVRHSSPSTDINRISGLTRMQCDEASQACEDHPKDSKNCKDCKKCDDCKGKREHCGEIYAQSENIHAQSGELRTGSSCVESIPIKLNGLKLSEKEQLRVERSLKVLDEVSMFKLVVGMDMALPIRDALITSLVGTNQNDYSLQSMLEFASNPHSSRNITRMCKLLERAFTDESVEPDLQRCYTGLAILKYVVQIVPRELRSQPLAMVAYVSWWVGQAGAFELARKALEYDRTCTLAAIVVSAQEHAIYPAWLESKENCSIKS